MDVGGGGVSFQAGQYIDLSVPEISETCPFSIASSPSEPSRIELHIRLVPGGRVTPLLHSNLKVGDQLPFTGPQGRFYVRKSAGKPLLFLAGGSGLSCPKSMILDLLEEGYDRPITLIHGARRPHDLHFGDLFRSLAQQHSNFRYVPVLSELEPRDEWPGERGFVHEAAKKLFQGRFAGHQAYLCGPPPMIDAAITTLIQGRLFERDIFMEKFLTRADADKPVRSPLFKRI
jgi:phenol hydroxylase P5 protein